MELNKGEEEILEIVKEKGGIRGEDMGEEVNLRRGRVGGELGIVRM